MDTNELALDLNKFGFCKAIRDSILQFDFKNQLNSVEEFNFHLSIGWCSSEYESELHELIGQLKSNCLVEPTLIKVKEFKVNIGNQEHKFYLKE